MTHVRLGVISWLLLCAQGCTVFDAGSELPLSQYHRVHSGAEALDFDPTSSILASGGWDGDVALWRPEQAKPLLVFQAHDSFVQDVAFARDRLVTAGFDGRLKLWNKAGALVAERDTGTPIDKMVAMGDRVVTAQHDGVLRFWRLPQLAPDGEWVLHYGPIASLAGHGPGGRIASGGFDGRVFLLSGNEPPRELEAPPSNARSLAFDQDGDRLYGGGWFRLFRWDLSNGSLEVMNTAHWGVISSLQYTPRERAIASNSRVNDSSVLFLDPDTGKTLRSLRRHPVCGTTLAVSPDGRYLANTGDDGLIRIFDLDNPPAR
ncbi:MAG: hypothetical protein OER43_05115 [Gammaproteobacteria bacterium]|nr:hypothetical protein [Gammaproteobacteria bacterium]